MSILDSDYRFPQQGGGEYVAITRKMAQVEIPILET
jgi:hypothetical protein